MLAGVFFHPIKILKSWKITLHSLHHSPFPVKDEGFEG
jgi:hypothetical protein